MGQLGDWLREQEQSATPQAGELTQWLRSEQAALTARTAAIGEFVDRSITGTGGGNAVQILTEEPAQPEPSRTPIRMNRSGRYAVGPAGVARVPDVAAPRDPRTQGPAPAAPPVPVERVPWTEPSQPVLNAGERRRVAELLDEETDRVPGGRIAQAVTQGTVDALVRGTAGTLGTLGEAAGALTGADGVGTAGRIVREASDDVSALLVPPERLQASPVEEPKLLADPEWWAWLFGQGLGSMAPMLAAGGLTGKAVGALARSGRITPGLERALTAWGPKVAGGLAEGAMAGAPAYQDAIREGKSPQVAAWRAAAVAAGTAATSAAALRLGVLNEDLTGWKRGAAGVWSEGGQETVQGGIEDLAAGRLPDAGAAVTNFAAGAVTGGGVGAATGEFSRLRSDAAPEAPVAERSMEERESPLWQTAPAGEGELATFLRETAEAGPAPSMEASPSMEAAPVPAAGPGAARKVTFDDMVTFARSRNGAVTAADLQREFGLKKGVAHNFLARLQSEGETAEADVEAETAAEDTVGPAPSPVASVAPVAPAPAAPAGKGIQLADTPPASGSVAARLPAHLAGAKPRYSFGAKQFSVSFDSDVDRAAYITAQEKRSKRDAEYVQFVQDATGLSEEEIRAHGARVRSQLKEQARTATQGGELRIGPVGPAQRAVRTAPAPPAPAPAPAPAPSPSPAAEGLPAGAVTGRKGKTKTARGSVVEFDYAVVDANDLVVSHDTGLNENPAFPQEMQPRDRTRKASEAQIADIAARLDPEELGESYKASHGAPIVGGDLVVESGNGRTIALQRLYQSGHANGQAYQNWVRENADRFGVDPEAAGRIARPVLVRVRRTPVDRVQFAKEANERDTAAMSASEQAASDAARITPELLETFDAEDGNVAHAGNRDFVRGFFKAAVSGPELGEFMTSDGTLSQAGVTRVRNAVFARAYGTSSVLETMAESTDSNIRNVTAGMLQAAPQMVRLRAGVEAGDLHPVDLGPDVAAAAAKLGSLRNAGQTLEDYRKQISLFGDELSAEAKNLLELFGRLGRSPKKIGTILRHYAESAEAAGSPKQAGMFGPGQAPTKMELLDAAVERAERESNAGRSGQGQEPGPEAAEGQQALLLGGPGEAGGGGEAAGADGPAGAGAAEEAGGGTGKGREESYLDQLVREARAARLTDAAGIQKRFRVSRPAAEAAARRMKTPETDWLDRAETGARKRLKSSMSGDQLNANPVGLIGDLAIVGAAKLRRGVTAFRTWRAEMLGEFGPRFRALALKVWAGSKRLLGSERGSFSRREVGPHGPVFREFRHNAAAAIAKLRELQDGEATAALQHPEVGDIDLIWGREGTTEKEYDDGYGLAKIVRKHPEVLERLQGILLEMKVDSRSPNRVKLSGEKHRAIVRLTFDDARKTWLMTAFEPGLWQSSAGRRTGVSGTSANESGETPSPKDASSSITSQKTPVKRKDGERGSVTVTVPKALRPSGMDRQPRLRDQDTVLESVMQFLRPAGSTLAKSGPEGKQIRDLIAQATDDGEVRAGQRTERLEDSGLGRLSREERHELVDVLEGRTEPGDATEAVARAARAIREITDEMAEEAEIAGVMVRETVTVRPGDPRPDNLTPAETARLDRGRNVEKRVVRPFKRRRNYFPHVMPPARQLRDVTLERVRQELTGRTADAAKPQRTLPGGASQVRRDVIANLVRMGVRRDTASATKFLNEYVEFLESARVPASLVQYLLDTGQAQTKAQAISRLSTYRQEQVRRQGSLEYARQVHLPFWDPDPARVLPHFVRAGSVRLAQIEEFGQENEEIDELVKRMAERAAADDVAGMRKIVDEILGMVNEPDTKAARLARLLRTLQGYKLGLAQVTNATQGVLNSWLAADAGSMLAGVRGAMRREGRRFATRSGAALDSALGDILRVSEDGALAQFLRATGFSATERLNRVIAANAGAHWAQKLYRRLQATGGRDAFARERLAELGLDPDRLLDRGGPDEGDILLAAKKFSDMTQFRNRVEDVPAWASTTWGKVLFQFKTFAYNQMRLVLKETLGEIGKGRFGRGVRNILLLATAFPIAGELVRQIRGVLTGKPPDEEGIMRVVMDAMQTGALGLLGDVVGAASRGGMADLTVGPGAGAVLDLTESLVADVRWLLGLRKQKRSKTFEWFLRQAPFGSVTRRLLTA
jgi:hypothetical protein